MFDRCSYHLLDSLVPPLAGEQGYVKETLMRLEHLSACAIVRQERNCQVLSKTADNLHKVLWKAYLLDKFYANDGNLGGLEELLYHWPYEEFVLKKVMPKLPAMPRLFASFPNGSGELSAPFDEMREKLCDFYRIVVETITDTIKWYRSKSHHEQHATEIKVKKIDISGFYIFDLDDISEPIEMKEPFSFGKIEVTLDIISYNKTALIYESNDSVVPKFSHVSLCNSILFYKGEDTMLVERLINNGTKSLLLGVNVEGSVCLETVLETISKANAIQENIQSLNIGNITSLNFVQYLKNLVHLQLDRNDLHGLLEPVKHMNRGLLYLSLVECNIHNEDLVHLSESCHHSTLQELNLTYNVLSYDDYSNNLIDLCNSLTNILHLDFYACKLESWPNDEIKLLFDSFKLIPNIVKLDLAANRFTIDIITAHIMVLQENTSLRYLGLSVPKQVTESQVELFCAVVNQKMNDIRSQLLYIDFSI